MSKKRQVIIGLAVVGALYVGYAILGKNPQQEQFDKVGLSKDIVRLDQNWSEDIRQQFNFTTFGSRLMPYEWFLNIEVEGSEQKLRSDEVLGHLGFILQDIARNNPEGLPVGFAVDDREETKWVGLTCAACHAGEITYQDQKIYIDGGPGLMDFTGFEQTVYGALKSTYEDTAKFDRFAAALKQSSPEDKTELKETLQSRVDFFRLRLEANATEVPYGYGRVDAFGQIFNAIAVEAMDIPSNRHVPDGPVSIPVLWDASHLDLVQWNASAANSEPGPLGQNATTALAVYGQIDMPGSKWFGYSSTIAFRNLGYIQTKLYELTSPVWPEQILGEIDKTKAAAGKKLYEQNCASCHTVIDRADPTRKLKAGAIPLEQIGTDPKMVENFVNARAKTGPLEGRKSKYIVGEPFPAEVATFDMVLQATLGSMIRHPLQAVSAVLNEKRDVYTSEPFLKEKVYKARPLNGMWAAAPYLHNGSVPTLYDLLLPATERPVSFYVGNKELDPVKVGFVTEQGEHSNLFDTTLLGNSNSGHEFGAALTEEERWALVEYLKTL